MEMTKSQLTLSRQRLIELIQELNFGQIEGLQICDGEPVLDPLPAITKTYLMGNDNGPHAVPRSEVFALKRQVREMFRLFSENKSFCIKRLIVNDGLPIRMDIEGVIRE